MSQESPRVADRLRVLLAWLVRQGCNDIPAWILVGVMLGGFFASAWLAVEPVLRKE